MTNDFTKAISKQLKALYPTYKIYVDEQKQGFTEPCFFIKLVNNNLDKKLDRRRDKEILYDILCFQDKQDESVNFDFQDISDNLQENLELIQVGTVYFRTKNKESEVVDDILHFKFKINVSAYVAAPNVSPINEVTIDSSLK